MKTRLAFILIISIGLISISFSKFISKPKICSYMPTPPKSGGAAATGLGDKTGSPLSSGTCSQCHSGQQQGSTTVELINSSGSVVNNYLPGQSYIIRTTVVSPLNSTGSQTVALTANNNNAGTMTNAITPNTQISTVSNVDYMEHQGTSSSNVFEVNWISPASGTGPISLYAAGLGVNNAGGSSGDSFAGNDVTTIVESVPTSISYTSITFCTNDQNPFPSISGEQGGVFSSSPGIVVDGVTGEIDLTLSSPGTYTIDYQYSQGTASYFVSINSIDLTTDIVTACDSYTWIDGNTYSSSNNTATFTSTNAAGCDSIITLDLTIVPNPDLSVTQNGATLTSNQSGATYQWVDCDQNFAVITGETNQTFTPSSTGNYAVIVTFNGCSDVSDCNLVDFTNLNEINSDIITLHPNPTSDFLKISGLNKVSGVKYLEITSTKGELIMKLEGTKGDIDVSKLDKGIYLLNINHNKGVETIRFIKE